MEKIDWIQQTNERALFVYIKTWMRFNVQLSCTKLVQNKTDMINVLVRKPSYFKMSFFSSVFNKEAQQGNIVSIQKGYVAKIYIYNISTRQITWTWMCDSERVYVNLSRKISAYTLRSRRSPQICVMIFNWKENGQSVRV